jgi:hypothetical protein
MWCWKFTPQSGIGVFFRFCLWSIRATENVGKLNLTLVFYLPGKYHLATGRVWCPPFDSNIIYPCIEVGVRLIYAFAFPLIDWWRLFMQHWSSMQRELLARDTQFWLEEFKQAARKFFFLSDLIRVGCARAKVLTTCALDLSAMATCTPQESHLFHNLTRYHACATQWAPRLGIYIFLTPVTQARVFE